MSELRAFRVTLEPKAQRDLRDHRVTPGQLDLRVQLDRKALRVTLEPLDRKAQQEAMEPTEPTETASQAAPTTLQAEL